MREFALFFSLTVFLSQIWSINSFWVRNSPKKSVSKSPKINSERLGTRKYTLKLETRKIEESCLYEISNARIWFFKFRFLKAIWSVEFILGEISDGLRYPVTSSQQKISSILGVKTVRRPLKDLGNARSRSHLPPYIRASRKLWGRSDHVQK